MASLFLSYAREDHERASALAGALERAGHQVWWDRRITGGTEFEREIEQALADAEIVVVAWSATAAKSHWVRDEAATGRDSDRLVPVTLDGTPPPLGFRQFHTIDLSKWSGSTRACAEVEHAVAAKAAQHHSSDATATADSIEPSRPTMGARLSPWPWRWIAPLTLAVLAITAGLVWWLARPVDASATRLSLARFEAIGGGLDAGISAAVEQELRTALTDARVALTAERADLVLTGAIRRVGGSLRLTARLDEVAGATTLWTRSQDIAAGDARALSEAARTIVTIVGCGIDGARAYSRQLESNTFSLYLRYCDASSVGQGLDAARATTRAAPDFVSGWLALASAAAVYAYQNPSAQDRALLDEALAAARRATELAPGAANGYIWLALLTAPERPTEREELFRRALALPPLTNFETAFPFTGDFLMQVGRTEEALEVYRRATDQGEGPGELWRLTMAYQLTGRQDRATETMQRLETLHPSDGLMRRYRRERAVWARRWAEAAEQVQLARTEEQDAIRDAYLALQSREPARIAAAAAAVEALPLRHPTETVVVPTLVLLNRMDAAFAALETSRQRGHHYSAPGRYPGVPFPLLGDPSLRPLWSDPRFPAFLQRAGFIAYWRASRTHPDLCRAASPPPFCQMLGRQG